MISGTHCPRMSPAGSASTPAIFDAQRSAAHVTRTPGSHPPLLLPAPTPSPAASAGPVRLALGSSVPILHLIHWRLFPASAAVRRFCLAWSRHWSKMSLLVTCPARRCSKRLFASFGQCRSPGGSGCCCCRRRFLCRSLSRMHIFSYFPLPSAGFG